MRLEFVKAFVELTESVFFETLGDKVITSKLSLESSPRVEGSVATIIELSGNVRGKIILGMNMPTAIAIAERMRGRGIPSRPLIASCMAELTSMAVGRAISWINDHDCYVQISPPIVAMEVRLQLTFENVETLVFPLKTV